MPFQFQLFLVI